MGEFGTARITAMSPLATSQDGWLHGAKHRRVEFRWRAVCF